MGRDTPHFQDACTELFDIAGASRANWAATPPRRQALAVAATVSQLAPPVKLTIAVPPENAFSFAALYRLTKDQALPSYFELGWRRAYPGLSGLMGASCNSAEALRLTGRLLAAPPSESGLDSLSARVLLLLSHLDTAVLRTAPASDRVTKMEGLLKGGGGSASADGLSLADPGSVPSDASARDNVTWGRILAKPETKALVTALEALNVVPLVEYRVARLLLSSPSALGIHVIAGTSWSKPPTQLFRAMTAAFGDKSTLLAVQRRMCVQMPENTLAWPGAAWASWRARPKYSRCSPRQTNRQRPASRVSCEQAHMCH